MRLAAVVLVLLATVAASSAATLGIDGTYGSAAGCKYAADGVYGDEGVSVLDDAHYENFVTWCEFVQVLPARDGSRIVTMLCGHEGDEAQTIETIRIVKASEGGALTMFRASGEQWDRLERCEAAGAKPR